MSRKFEKPEQYVFRSNNGEKFKLLAVSPHKTNPLCVLVVASHTTTSGAYKKDEVLLLQARAEGGLLLSTRVATSPKPLVFLIWDLVPWVTEQRHQQVHELIITATGENILINQFRDEVLVPQCRLSCGVPVTACVMQRWLPRIVYAGGAGAGKIDLIFNKSKIEINNVLQFPPWMKEDKKLCFLSIGCVENKSEVLLGDSEGKIYLFGVPQCTVATVGEKFTILRDMTVPFPVNALAVAPQGRGLSTLKVVAVGVSGNARLAGGGANVRYSL
nr:uncharacterized protein LOC128702371 [Cherax quadricarinatus]